MVRYKDMTAIIEANRRAGGHFFDKQAMEFFDTRLYPQARGPGARKTVFPTTLPNGKEVAYFVTSEQFHQRSDQCRDMEQDTLRESLSRKFTVRICNSEARIRTIGTFMAYDTLDEALAAIHTILDTEVST